MRHVDIMCNIMYFITKAGYLMRGYIYEIM